MKKNARKDKGNLVPLTKMLRIMKISAFLLLISLQISATNYGQARLNLNDKNITILDILKKIESQTSYRFSYRNDLLPVEKVISIRVVNADINEVMKKVFEGVPVDWQIVKKRNIIISPTSKSTSKKEAVILPISGIVTDAEGVPLVGVSIIEKGTTNGTTSNEGGRFDINVTDRTAVLVFSHTGFTPREMIIPGNTTNLQVVLQKVSGSMDEVVVVGYTTQKRANLTGAVSDVKGDEIIATKNENVQNMLTGRLPGLRVTQTSSEPGSFAVQMDIRAMGSPLIVIDGVPRDNEALQRLDPNDIDNISILKDATAAVYGVRAANGVVLVTTKRGRAGKSELSYSGSYLFQFPSGLPGTVDAVDNMILRNEASMHRLQGQTHVYSDDQINEYKSGAKTSTNWKDLVFKAYGPQTIHNVSATGGTDKLKYYFGAGYEYQGSFFKTDDLNYKKYNIRSTITANITDHLKAEVLMNFITDEQDRSDVDSWWIIRGFWKVGPFFPAYANNDPTKLNYNDRNDGDNPVAYINSSVVGNRKYMRKWIQPAAKLRYDFPLVKGLYIQEMVSYDWNMWDFSRYGREYQVYKYDDASKTYQGFSLNSPSQAERGMVTRNQLLSQSTIGYDKKFGVHNVSGLLVWETQKRWADNFNAKRNLILPIPYLFAGVAEGQIGSMNPNDIYEMTNLGLVGTFHYDYASKYLLDYSFRYDGSSKFASGHQWGYFPSVAAAWRISEEKFFKAALPAIDQLKLRASYGLVGDDGASSYQFISGYNYPTGGSDRRWFTAGYVFGNSFLASADNKGIPNPQITWFTARTFNAGFDFSAWNGLLGVTAEYFSRKRDGLLARRYGGIPTVVGAGLPEENINSDRTYGYELQLSHRNRIGDLAYGLKGMVSLVRIMRLYVERGPIGSSWSNWKNNQNDRLQGVSTLLDGAGQYQNWNDIWNSKTYTDAGTLPGDYKYVDWNGDGEINGNDAHPLRFNQNPWMNFSLSGDAQYKGFDASFLFQGQAMATTSYGEKIQDPLWGGGYSGILDQFTSRWHPTDPTADPYSTKTAWEQGTYAYTGSRPEYWSTFNTVNAAYLRLKNVELGYSIPAAIIKRVGISGIRVYASAYNLVTFTKVKYIDPEHNNDLWGYIYPLNKSVSLGINVRF